jgi:structural maintenance of chromosome 1
MPVRRLELENFKSYAGFNEIGPFENFTSIIGPNGSGKSNLMDAISFVLGVQSRDLRSSQMKDLIYRHPGTISDQNRRPLRASATLVYEDEDRQREFRFTRVISPKAEYRVNDKACSFAEYEKALGEIGVLVKARNFLVFQGDVESLARKSPTELVALLETISGSIAYKEEYEKFAAQKEEAEAVRLFIAKQKKALEAERHNFKQQAEEAEKFHTLIQQKTDLCTDYFLFQLFHLDQDRVEREMAAKEIENELEQAQQMELEAGLALKNAKKAASTARRHTAQADKQRIELASTVDQLEPKVIQTSEEIKNLRSKLKQDEAALAKKNKEAETHDTKLAELEQQIQEFQKTERDLVQEYEQAKRNLLSESTGSAQVMLTAEQEDEYERVKTAAAAASAEPRRRLANANSKLETARSQIAAKTSELEAAKQSVEQIETDIAEISDRIKAVTTSIAKTTAEITSSETELTEYVAADRRARQRREEIDAELVSLHAELSDFQNAKRRDKDEERLLAAIATLKRNFPGSVHGRLVDLCRPTQRKFAQAVTVAAGVSMDGIVVDTKNTGVECIRYLREQRIGTATFLPLDTIQIPSLESTESLRARVASDPRYRLAVDVVTTTASDDNGMFRRAIAYAVGNTVICDDLDSARELCFGGGKRGTNTRAAIKAVTLGGAVISKAGTMTGGVTRDSDSEAGGRWRNQDVEKLRDRKEALEAERAELDGSVYSRGQQRRGRVGTTSSSKIEELRNNLGSLKNRDQYSKSELEYNKKHLKEQQVLLQSTQKQVPKLEKQVAVAEKEIEKLLTAVKKSAEEVKQAEDEHLGPFRETTGLRDLNAYEEAMGKTRDEFNEKKKAIVEHITQLEQQKEYEAGRDLKQPIVRIEKRIKERKVALKKAEKVAEELQQKIDVAKEKLSDAEEKLNETSEREKGFEETVQTAQTEYTEAQTACVQLKKQKSAEEAALERLRGKLHETLQKARVEKVELPMVWGEEEESASHSRTATRSHRRSRGTIQHDDEDIDDSALSQHTESQPMSQSQESARARTQFSQVDNPVVVRDQEQASKVDFSQMKEEFKRRLSDREEKKMRKEFEDKISKISAEIESLSPNMKAEEALSAATKRLKESKIDHDKAKDNATKAAQAYQIVRAKRTKCFMEAYHHIEEALKTIYTDMTKSSKHPLGGNAYLSLDDTDEPYKGGLKFNAMPPMKRFRDMEQLSGGEKTVAALSLLFAIHSFHPAPFFVMDEVDAALDNINLRKVVNYVSQRSKTDFQCIVISLKDMFYEHSESLIGICRDVDTSSSRTLTLDLRKYDEQPVHRGRKRTMDSTQDRSRSRSVSRSSKRSAHTSSAAESPVSSQ